MAEVGRNINKAFQSGFDAHIGASFRLEKTGNTEIPRNPYKLGTGSWRAWENGMGEAGKHRA